MRSDYLSLHLRFPVWVFDGELLRWSWVVGVGHVLYGGRGFFGVFHVWRKFCRVLSNFFHAVFLVRYKVMFGTFFRFFLISIFGVLEF